MLLNLLGLREQRSKQLCLIFRQNDALFGWDSPIGWCNEIRTFDYWSVVLLSHFLTFP
jgi:hypothetical protein